MITKQALQKALKDTGFTLLELLIVMSILVVVAGATFAALGPLDKKMAKGRSTFDLGAIDRGVRLFKVVTGDYPQELDLLTLSDTTVGDVSGSAAVTASAGGFCSRMPAELEGSDGNQATSDGKLHFFKATSRIVAAFSEAGIDTVRGILTADDSSEVDTPNLAYHDAPTGVGSEVAIVPDLVLPIIKSKNLGAADSGLLQAITGFEPDVTHLVVVLGLGNSSSIVSDYGGVNSAFFSEAPSDSDVGGSEYGRFLLLFHVGSDSDDSDTIEDSEIFSSVVFVGAIDATGDWLEEQFKAAFESKE